jgi:hypothetical protein
MGRIVLSMELAAALRNCKAPSEICDSDGNIIGYFEPPPRLYEPGEIPDFDQEELDRREKTWLGILASDVRHCLIKA